METAILQNNQTTRSIERVLPLNTTGYLTGKDNIVWATYDVRQAETIRNALLAQHIGCELKEMKSGEKTVHLLRVSDERGLEEAMDFIWRDNTGLRLKPDWSYADGETNKSFEQWLGG